MDGALLTITNPHEVIIIETVCSESERHSQDMVGAQDI